MRSRALWEVFTTFSKLGWSSFGGPTAHIGYFYSEFVERRRWFSAETFANDNALCQIMPGPASSQLGMLIGARRAGILGSLVAWVAFTAPSALIMLAILLGNSWWMRNTDLVQGFMIGAAAVVAHAIWGMSQTFCRDNTRTSITFVSAIILLLVPTLWAQLFVLLGSMLVGSRLIVPDNKHNSNYEPIAVPLWLAQTFLGVFAVLLAYSLWVTNAFTSIFQAGAFVFGGGHVVVAMLQQRLVSSGIISNELLLSGYAAAQALPGPLFTFALFVGGVGTTQPVINGFSALIAIFLPGWLLIIGVQPWWQRLQRIPWVQTGLQGVQAAVVGILAATLWQPIMSHAIQVPWHMALWLCGVALLTIAKRPAWQISFGSAALCWIVGVF